MSPRLMVIDDDAGIAKVMGLAATQIGMKFLTVDDPVEAIERYTEYRPDIVVLDMIMPGKDGIDVLRDILRTGIPSKIVLTSGFGETYLRLARGLAAFYGAAEPVLLPKPFRRRELIDVLTNLVSAASSPGA